MIKLLIKYLIKKGHIPNFELQDNLDKWVDDKIHRDGIEVWGLFEDQSFTYAGKNQRFLIFNSKDLALRWAENNISVKVYARKVWLYK